MRSSSKALLVVTALGVMGLWGCSQNKDGVTNTRIRDLEARHAKLEEDYRGVLAANDTFRKKLSQAETRLRQLEGVVRERDELQTQLNTRTGERDNLHNQLVQFGQELQSLVGRVEAAAGNRPTPPAAATVSTVSREKS